MSNVSIYLCDGFALASILLAILSIANPKKPHLSLVYLIGVFVTASLILLYNNLMFTGIAYLIVYVGAILVLFLFVILLINLSPEDINSNSVLYLRIAGLIGTVLIFFTLIKNINTDMDTLFDWYNPISTKVDLSVTSLNQVQSLGAELYSSITLLTIIGIVLLLAMLSVIILSRREE